MMRNLYDRIMDHKYGGYFVLLFVFAADAVNVLLRVTFSTDAVTLIPSEIKVLNIELCSAPDLDKVATLVVEL
jgi:hypothetical protein